MRRLHSRQAVVIATGTTAAIPPVTGLREARPWTPRDATNLREVPHRVAVIGGGVVGRESTIWLNGLGAQQFTIIEPEPALLAHLEPSAGALHRRRVQEVGHHRPRRHALPRRRRPRHGAGRWCSPSRRSPRSASPSRPLARRGSTSRRSSTTWCRSPARTLLRDDYHGRAQGRHGPLHRYVRRHHVRRHRGRRAAAPTTALVGKGRWKRCGMPCRRFRRSVRSGSACSSPASNPGQPPGLAERPPDRPGYDRYP